MAIDDSVKHQFHWTSYDSHLGSPAKLILKDKSEFCGYSIGYVNDASAHPQCLETTGEVVFSTAMVGYAETLTDPSYSGQILVFTYPIVGNYGIPSQEIDEFGLLRWFESALIHLRGLVICDYTVNDSHWSSIKTLSTWLKEQKIPAIAGVDTRALTKHLRSYGTILGRIVIGNDALCDSDDSLFKDECFYNPDDYPLNMIIPTNLHMMYTMEVINGERYVRRFEFPEDVFSEMLSNDPYTFHKVSPAELDRFCVFDGVSKSPVQGVIPDADFTSSASSSSVDDDTPRVIVVVDCGTKNNIIRCLLRLSCVTSRVLIVPSDYDFTLIPYDGLIISNGPGDPKNALETISNIKKAMLRPAPIFGICLGNQLLGLAAGAKTYKMLCGNRGFNQPCIDLRTYKCYATAQNHGFAIDKDSLPSGWATLFTNANDNSVEGITHLVNPWFSVQFHPESSGGPTDTMFLMKDFIQCVEKNGHTPLYIRQMSTHVKRKTILLLSSGGLSIGQAGEFDYSGSQAIKALREAGAKVILINPNVATVQTSHGLADVIYFLPITFDFVSKIIEKERPDGIMCGFGGQTGLNCGIELYKSGILEEYDCEILGTSIEAILDTEDRARFNKKINEIGERCAPSCVAMNVDECMRAAKDLGYPVLIRSNFELGGFGSGFASNDIELRQIAEKVFGAREDDPEVWVYVDKALNGWKEIEFEILRDGNDNCVAAASMENLDPLGIHTGDSIVVAPAQTLNSTEYYRLREVAFKVVRHLGIVGECNIQIAVNPENEEYFIVELNARLSRSSALASKATGYPLAYIAAKIALGFDLVQMRNAITLVTTACYEPSLDYIVVKMPKWDLKKFEFASNALGSCMKSVGEVMAIGRTFEEAIQKALRMSGDGLCGFEAGSLKSADKEKVLDILKNPTPDRVSAIYRAFELGVSVEQINKLSLIDRWFIYKLERLYNVEQSIKKLQRLHSLTSAQMRYYKCLGFSDKQLATLLDSTEDAVRDYRKRLGVLPFIKLIDTLAAEYPAKTNYCYMTYHGIEHDVKPCKEAKEGVDYPGIIVLGCGPYRIGSSIEFDWSAVSCIKTLRNIGHAAIIVNCNPETVSTDFDVSDRLYFEELSIEIVDAIYQFENPMGIIISVGGQTANNLACKLGELGTNVLGTSVDSIDKCECRNKFSQICDVLGIDQPPWEEFTSVETSVNFCKKVGFPVLVRPSYVLSGASMRVILSFDELQKFLKTSAVVNRSHPVVISKFIEHAKEVEVDCVAQQGRIINYAISEHVEYAGTHSGDATLILPAQNIFVDTHRRVKKLTQKLSRYLNISGPFNVQFMCKNNQLKIIECNLRASRTLPFISKTLNADFIDLATRVMVNAPIRVHNIQLMDIDYVAVKMPIFSFNRLYPADPILGVEMKSTGEIAAFGVNKYEALLKAMLASGMRMPKNGVLLSLSGTINKFMFAKKIKCLMGLGLNVYATDGTYDYIQKLWESEESLIKSAMTSGTDGSLSDELHTMISSQLEFVDEKVLEGTSDKTVGKFLKVYKPSSKMEPSVMNLIKDQSVELFINVTDCVNPVRNTDGYIMRRSFLDARVTLITSSKLAMLFIDALMVQHIKTSKGKVFLHNKSHHEYIS